MTRTTIIMARIDGTDFKGVCCCEASNHLANTNFIKEQWDYGVIQDSIRCVNDHTIIKDDDNVYRFLSEFPVCKI